MRVLTGKAIKTVALKTENLYTEPSDTPVVLTKGDLVRLLMHAMAKASGNTIKSQGDINVWSGEAIEFLGKFRF